MILFAMVENQNLILSIFVIIVVLLSSYYSQYHLLA
jgi:hypothetical protein